MTTHVENSITVGLDENSEPVEAGVISTKMVPQLRQPSRTMLGGIGNKMCVAQFKDRFKKTKCTFVVTTTNDPIGHKQNTNEATKHEEPSRPLSTELTDSSTTLSLKRKVIDIDAEDQFNPFSCSEYANEIYHYLRSRETHFQVPSDFIRRHPQINERMRAILVDWLVQVHDKFRLVQETLFLTVSILDRYLIVDCKVTKDNLQLIGVTAMLLASKIEEIYSPALSDFVYITDNAYSPGMIKALESKMAAALDYSFGAPLCVHFLRRNSKAAKVDAEKHTLAKYFLELMLPDYESIQFSQSERAAASLCLAMKITDDSPWDATVEHYSYHSEESLAPCMKRIAQLVIKTSNKQSRLLSVAAKYNRAKFFKIASLPCLNSEFITEIAEV